MPPRKDDPADPRGLIYEAYRIEGIGEAQCRSIFLDWAIGVPSGENYVAHVRDLLERHGAVQPEHPMTQVLREALDRPTTTGRRGGARGRRVN